MNMFEDIIKEQMTKSAELTKQFEGLRIGGLYRIKDSALPGSRVVAQKIFFNSPAWEFVDALGNARPEFRRHHDYYKSQGNKEMCQWFDHALKNRAMLSKAFYSVPFVPNECFILLGKGLYEDPRPAMDRDSLHLRILKNGIHDHYMDFDKLCDMDYRIVLVT